MRRGGRGRGRRGCAEPYCSAVIRLIQNDVEKYPFHKQPPTYVRAQRYKYWFSHPGEQR